MKQVLLFLLAFCTLLALTACYGQIENHTPGLNLITDATEAAEATQNADASTSEAPTTEATQSTDLSTSEAATTEPIQSTEPSTPTESPAPTTPVNHQSHTNYNAFYEELVNDYAKLIRFRFSDSFDTDRICDFPGISNTLKAALSNLGGLESRWSTMAFELSYNSAADNPRFYGYILQDINADGIPELFWVRNDHSIVAIFTYHNNRIVLLDAYWSRYRGYVAWNNTLYTWGSGGAADAHCSSLSLTANGSLYDGYGFYSESNWNTVNYFEYSGAAVNRISQDRFHDLSDLYPSSHSQYWLSLPINSLPSTPESETSSSPYLVKISRGDFPIWQGPGYDYSKAGTVKVAGTYTIVAESRDDEGNLWGKLKSGAGWVDLSLLEREKANPPLITVDYADRDLLQSGNFHYCIADRSEYTVQLAFRAYASLTDVSFFSIDCSIGYAEGPELFYIDRWDSSTPFVADVSFPGDMTMYGIRFTDSSGITHIYAVTMSGRTGPAFSLSTYVPTN